MIFCSKFIKTITSAALLAGVASSSFVSTYDMKLRRGMSCNEDKDISSRDSKLKALTKKDVTNVDDENLVKDDELDNDEDNRRVHKDNRSSYEDTDSVDKVPTVNKHETEKSVISKLKDNKPSSKTDLLKSLDFKTVASIISASSSIGILSGLSKKPYFDKKVNPTKPDEPEPYIQDDDKNKDNPDPHEKEKKKDEPGPSPVAPGNENSNKKYIWITLGVFGFVVLAVIFFYRKKFRRSLSRFVAAMYMKCFGVDKFVKNHDILSYNYDECKGLFKKILSNNDFQAWSNAYECTQYMKENGPVRYLDYLKNNAHALSNWKEVYKIAFGKDIGDDIAEKLLYRHKSGYKKYIENYPDGWWELYTQGYIEPKFIPKAEKMYVFYVYDTESPLEKKMDKFYKKKPGNNDPQFKQWSEEYNNIRENKQEINEYFANNFYKDLKTDISSLAGYFFDDGINFRSENFIIKDGELKFLSNENEYDLDKFGAFLLYDDDGDPYGYEYSSRATKSTYFTFLLKDDNEMLAGVIESLDKKLEYNKYLKTYSLNEKNFFNDLFTNVNNFLKLKFKNFDDNDEKKIFVDGKLESIKKIINKANNRIEKAFEVYQKYKSSAESLKKCKINFLADYILLGDNELKQKYNFLKDEDLKIEPEPVENIIEMDNIISNNP